MNNQIHGLTFLSISFRNFMSFGNNMTTIELDQPRSTAIMGQNLDDTTHGITSNGVGKSTVLNAIVYALYDTPISDISKDDLVNNINNKNMEVSIEFTKNNTHYKVTRERKTKAGSAGNNTYVFIDGVDKTEAGQANKQIIEILGIPYELFVRITAFSTSLRSFMDLETPKRSAFLEELFGTTLISEKADKLKAVIKSKEQSIEMQRMKLTYLENEHATFEKQKTNIETKLKNWNDQHALDKQNLLQKLSELDGNVNFDELREQRQQYDEAVVLNSQITNTIDKLKTEKNSNVNNISTLERQIVKLGKENDSLRSNICPYCKQDYKDTLDKINENDNQILQIENQIKEINSTIATIEDNALKLSDELGPIKELMNSLRHVPSFQVISKMEQEPIELSTKLSDLNEATNPYDELYAEILETELDEIDYTEINESLLELEHQKFLLKLLTKKDSFIRKAILNKNIPYLNNRLHQYLAFMGLPHKIEFTHDMGTKISLMGRSLGFGNLSAGQRARVNIALSIAFRDMLQLIHNSINLWFLDEVLDVGLDNIGIQLAAKLIKQKAKDEVLSLYVISHKDEIQGIFDNTMTIQLIKGFSYIK